MRRLKAYVSTYVVRGGWITPSIGREWVPLVRNTLSILLRVKWGLGRSSSSADNQFQKCALRCEDPRTKFIKGSPQSPDNSRSSGGPQRRHATHSEILGKERYAPHAGHEKKYSIYTFTRQIWPVPRDDGILRYNFLHDADASELLTYIPIMLLPRNMHKEIGGSTVTMHTRLSMKAVNWSRCMLLAYYIFLTTINKRRVLVDMFVMGMNKGYSKKRVRW